MKFFRSTFYIVLSFVLVFSSTNFSFAQDCDQIIAQMISEGYNQAKADRLLCNWSSVKHSLVKYAKDHQQDPEKLKVLAQICHNRFQAREDAVMNAVKDAVKAGYSEPIEAMVPTGGWKKASNMNPTRSNYYDYILEASNADIDETFFGKMGATEYVAERASFRYAQRALGRNLGNTPNDYKIVNQILTDGEVTWFPRDPLGRYSPKFEENFPSVVLESYQGREGQAALEVGYLINKKKGLADIVYYDKNGNILRIVKNQPAESVINDLTNARYSTLQRLSKANQDYSHKYVDQVIKKGLQGDDRAEWAAKMLERMAGDESAITGKNLGDNPMLLKAAEVKKIMRTVKNPSQRAAELKKVLGNQSLDDFVQAAEDEMKRIDLRNRQRTAWMLDDDLGKSIQGGRLNTIMKGVAILSNVSIITDAYLRSHEGDRINAISKALATSLAADIAGGAVGKVVGAQVGAGVAAVVGKGAGVVAGGAAGFASGAIAGAIAGYVVNGTWEWTEEGVNNMLRGYKGDDAVKKIFLKDKNMIKDFVDMTPDEIKNRIAREWEEHYQFVGAYVGKLSGDHDDIKQYMLEKAIEQQFILKRGQLEGQIYGSILRQELAELVAKMEAGKLTPQELDEIRTRFGKNVSSLVNDKLKNDPKYAHYKQTLEKVDNKGGKPGLWDSLASNFDFRSENEILKEMNARFDRIIEIYDMIDSDLSDYSANIASFYSILNAQEIDGVKLAGSFNDASISLVELKRGLESLRTNVGLFLADLIKTLGRLEDTSQFNYQKGEASLLLATMMERVNVAIARFAELERIMRIKQKADRMKEEGKELVDKERENGENGKVVPAFVKKSKENKKTEPPAFVSKSKKRTNPKLKPSRDKTVVNKKIVKDPGGDLDLDTIAIADGKLPDFITQRKYFNVYCSVNVMKHGKMGTLETEERTVGPQSLTFSFGGRGSFQGRTFIVDQEYADEYKKEILKARVILSPDAKTIEKFKIVKKHYSYSDKTDKTRVTSMREFSLSGSNIPLKNLYYADYQALDACSHIDSFSYRSKDRTIYYTVKGYECSIESRLKINF